VGEGIDRHLSRVSEEDWRNRKKWDQYEQAACDIIDRISTERAPWTLVEANENIMRGSRF
ncbi:MAG: hypothetical protein L0Y39_07195, partial [Methylococcaceae bacterium]|nr:hypothetical protein [Methylococcaceae bacterium]